MLIDKNRTPEERDLLTNIAFYTGKLNKVRGDRVDLQEMSFPASTLQIQREQQKAEQEKQIQELEKEREEAEARAAQKPCSDLTPAKAQDAFLNPTTMLLIALGILVLILIFVMVSRGKKEAVADSQMQIQQPGQGEEAQAVSAQQAMADSNAEYQEAIEVDK